MFVSVMSLASIAAFGLVVFGVMYAQQRLGVFCAVCRLCIWSQTCLARTRRMAISPIPVAEQAPASLSAYVPAPIRGVSPILPGHFSAKPPVEVEAAVFPCFSNATAPTVSVSNRFGLA